MLVTGTLQAVCSQQNIARRHFLSTSVAREQVARYKYVSNCDACTRKTCEHERATREHKRVTREHQRVTRER